MVNRLASATSPYLLQHAENPVDWWEWGPEAFAEARRRDTPVLLSVGYAACHWCHVMAHESFEDPDTARYLNERFVSIKVDREERPDIDAIYMQATQAMTGQGGWPMTCVLTHAGEPFFAGTYFPPEPRQGMPGFRQLLEAISTAWLERRKDIDKVGRDIVAQLQQPGRLPAGRAEDVTEAAVTALIRSFDQRYAGFGGAPKFPPSMVCEFLLRHAARTGDDNALTMASRTLEAMARGGMYDQLGGGFARYSVDERWDVPHFEKMLYDNALLLRVYVHWWRQTGSALAERVARETAVFLIRELGTDQGGLASALDADSDGAEGTFYVWSRADLVDALGEDEGRYAADVFSVSDAGNFEHGTSTLRLDADPVDPARHRDVVRRLLAARERRVRPARDDKVVAAWNGLAISALAEAGLILDEPRCLDAAHAAARLLVDVHLAEGRLRRVSRDGVAGEPAGVLDDYACVADGFLTLFGASGEQQWFDHAERLIRQILERFPDGSGGFFDTSDDAEPLVTRPQEPGDNASPSGQGMTATVLASMFGLTGDDAYLRAGQTLIDTLAGLAEAAPRFAGQTLSAAEALADGPRQIAIAGDPADPARDELLRAAFRLPHPGAVVAVGDGATATAPLLEGRGLVDGCAAAYVCRGFVCDLPVTDLSEPPRVMARTESDKSGGS
ncbi:MAG: thioredoxin domain-containing protein [Nocardioidaceae bacterium]